MTEEKATAEGREAETLGFRRTISVTSFNSDGNDDKTGAYESAPDSCLVKYNGQFFDVFPFLQEHPGGRLVLEKFANKDVSIFLCFNMYVCNHHVYD